MSDPDQNETTATIVAIVNDGLDNFERSARSSYRRNVTRPSIVQNSIRHDRTAGTVTLTIENVNPAIDIQMLIDCATKGLNTSGFGRGVMRTAFDGSELIYVLTIEIPHRSVAQDQPAATIESRPPRNNICGFRCCAKYCIFVTIICSIAVFGLSFYAALTEIEE